MEAGRDLDARIAEMVFRWQWYIADNVQYLRSPHPFAYGCVIDSEGTHYLKALPAYSTDIAAAWLVVEQIHQRGLCVSVSALHEWDTKYECSVHHESILDVVASGEADTAPLAICRAALAAVQE